MNQKLRVYVAASSKELERAKWAMAQVRALGHDITHDWVRCVEQEGEANPAAATLSQCQKWAWDDLEGVSNADVVWVLMPDQDGFGAGVELGYALSNPYMRIICSGPTRRSIFSALADNCFPNDSDVVEELRYV